MMGSAKRVESIAERVGFCIANVLVLFLLVFLTLFALRIGEGLGLVKTAPYDYLGSTWVSESPAITLYVSPGSRTIEDSEAYITVDGEEIPVLIFIERGKIVSIDRRPAISIDDILLRGHLQKMTRKEVVIEVTEDHAFSGQYKTITLKRVG